MGQSLDGGEVRFAHFPRISRLYKFTTSSNDYFFRGDFYAFLEPGDYLDESRLAGRPQSCSIENEFRVCHWILRKQWWILILSLLRVNVIVEIDISSTSTVANL